MTHRSLFLMAILTCGLVAPPVFSQASDQPGVATEATAQPAGRTNTIDTYVQAIEQAQEPSAAVSAYAKGYAIDPQNRALQEAYVSRMVEFGLPRAAYNQAQTLVDIDRGNGLAWAVLSYVAARQGQMAEALVDIVQAASLRPDHWFVQEVAGQLLAWYDTTRPTVSDSLRNSLDKIRRNLGNQKFFADAYQYALNDLQQAEASQTQPAQTTEQAQRLSQPGYQSGTAGIYPSPESLFPYSSSYIPMDLYSTEPFTDPAYSYIPSYPGYASPYASFYPNYPYGMYYPTYQPTYYPYYYDYPFLGYPYGSAFYPFFPNNITVVVKDKRRLDLADLFLFRRGFDHKFGDRFDGRFGSRFDRFDRLNRGRAITGQVDGRRLTHIRPESRIGEPDRRVPIFRGGGEQARLSFGRRDTAARVVPRGVERGGGVGYGSQAQNPQGVSVIPRLDAPRARGAQRTPQVLRGPSIAPRTVNPNMVQPGQVGPRRVEVPSRSFGTTPYVAPTPRSYSTGPRAVAPRSVAPRQYSGGSRSMGVPRTSVGRSAPAVRSAPAPQRSSPGAVPRGSVGGRSGGGGRR